jgi:hypothetical protein
MKTYGEWRYISTVPGHDTSISRRIDTPTAVSPVPTRYEVGCTLASVWTLYRSVSLSPAGNRTLDPVHTSHFSRVTCNSIVLYSRFRSGVTVGHVSTTRYPPYILPVMIGLLQSLQFNAYDATGHTRASYEHTACH